LTRRLEKAFRLGARKRLRLVFFLAAIFWGVLVARLFWVQVWEAERYQRKAKSQNFTRATQKAERGVIYDRNGIKLAYNIPAESFYAVPDSITNPRAVAARFSSFFDKDFDFLYRNLQGHRKFFWMARSTETPQAEQVKSWGFNGIYSREEMKRAYPLEELAGDLIGLTDVDNRGISGLELYFDSLLAGQDGSEILQKDALGVAYELQESGWKEAQPGQSLCLTLDAGLQWILESRLKEGILNTKSRSGFGILMNPRSGEILALANLSNPNYDYDDKSGRLRPITDQFEPGSTIKAFVAAAALEEKIKNPDDVLYAEMGKWHTGVGKRIIQDIHEYGNLSFKEAVAYSSNIALAKTGLAVGPEKLYKFLREFGFGFKTGIELPGEAAGKLQPQENWSRITVISNSIGYGISVSALQLATAYSAIANGGILVKPHLVKAITDADGELIKETVPQPLRRVISEETARTLREFLQMAVDTGTALPAKLEGVALAGKTGTAKKIKEGAKGYTDEYLSSFVGFFPTEEPRYLGFIALDSPKGMHYGGQTAAPVFKEIVRDILSLPSTPTLELIKQKNNEDDETAPMQTVAAKVSNGGSNRPSPNKKARL